MLEYVGIWFGTCAIVASVGGLAYMADKAMQRWWDREQANAAGDNASSPLYMPTDAKYGDRPGQYVSMTSPQLVMCGGCGKDIEPGTCPSGGCSVYKDALKENRIGAVD